MTGDDLSDADKVGPVSLDVYRQTDYLPTLTSVPLQVGGRVQEHPAPHGVVIVSQTCDVVQPTHIAVAVAPLIHVKESDLKWALKGGRPQWARVPTAGTDTFADLDFIGTIAKADIACHERHPGVTTLEEAQRFSQALARKFARFPFPDAVRPWLEPLRKLFTKKANSETSPLGRLLDQVVELRVEAFPDWYGDDPLQLMLHILVSAGALPTFPDGSLPEIPDDLLAWLYDPDGEPRPRKPSDVAERLGTATDPVARYWLWQMFGQAVATVCHPSGRITSDEARAAARAVDSVTADVVAIDEYTYDRARRSVELDLEFLSPPMPASG